MHRVVGGEVLCCVWRRGREGGREGGKGEQLSEAGMREGRERRRADVPCRRAART